LAEKGMSSEEVTVAVDFMKARDGSEEGGQRGHTKTTKTYIIIKTEKRTL